MINANKLLIDYKRKLEKALGHLEYSFKKIGKLPHKLSELDDEGLEVWESFSARFSRVADLFLTKYIRALVLQQDPGFQGSLRDFVDQGEKLGIIDDAEVWMEIRALRNITAHEYTEEEMEIFLQNLKVNATKLLSIKSKI